MPEDIPEDLEFTPDPIPETFVELPSKKPDIGLLSIFVGGVLTVTCTLLGVNHVNINWMWAALFYGILIMGCVWTFLKHGVPHWEKFFKIGGVFAIAMVGGWVAFYGVRSQYVFDHSPVTTTDTNVLAAVNGEGDKIEKRLENINNAWATNPSDLKSTALYSERSHLIQEGEDIEKRQAQTKRDIFNEKLIGLERIRIERTNDISLKENRESLAKNRQQIEDAQKENAAKIAEAEAAKQKMAADENRQMAIRELLKCKKTIAAQVFPVFDYAIFKLNKLLDQISHDTGERGDSDFTGETPAIYSSDMEKDGILKSGSNFIRLGTNSAWKFNISTEISAISAGDYIDLHTAFPPHIKIQFRPPYAKLRIAVQSSNTESILTITPLSLNGNKDWDATVGNLWGPVKGDSFSDPLFSNIAINLQVPNGLDVGQTNTFDNYKDTIDIALHHLIGAQDQQFRLTLKK
ncbi:MAG TPA: hypothetical protein VG347_17005 [Verrucomicrobiae bacterium]|nr:hypothetical protein [Verrucomicrobiae bacterium]